MNEFPEALKALTEYNQFILWMPVDRGDGRVDKLPINPRTGLVDNGHDPAVQVDIETALECQSKLDGYFGIAFVLTNNDPFFFIDIDHCGDGAGGWLPLARTVCDMFPGIAQEVSQSGTGLHLIGKTAALEHGCKNTTLDIELYTSGRILSFSGGEAYGDASLDFTPNLQHFAATYIPAKQKLDTGWTYEPVENSNPIEDDDKLIEQALKSKNVNAKFGHSICFADLWNCEVNKLAAAYPSSTSSYDASSADAALATHLTFWTGNNCERISKLMKRSKLLRDKWDRSDYLPRTILGAAAINSTSYYNVVSNEEAEALAETFGASKLRASSDSQRKFAENVRNRILMECEGDADMLETLCKSKGKVAQASFWLDNQELSPQELVELATPLSSVPTPENVAQIDVQRVSGYQFVTPDLQVKYFAGCVYIVDIHRIFTASGAMLRQDQFNALYGGYVFQMDADGDKTSTKAWDAFTLSQVLRMPKADSTCFRPAIQSGEIVVEQGVSMVNTYVKPEIDVRPGDVQPLLDLIALQFPNEYDRSVIMAYSAALVQYPGVKFQWCPVIQGVEGNGKSLIARLIKYTVGAKYTHAPRPSNIDNEFNGWLVNKIFINVADINVDQRRRIEIIETLKPMITDGDDLEITLKGVDAKSSDICANFMMTTNHKDGLPKTKNDRRFAIFFTAHQTPEDLTRDGLDGEYFPNLYAWLKEDGYAHFAHYLQTYPIPNELNPATLCHRAPFTSSTNEALTVSLSPTEQAIVEAIEEGRQGFAGGWVSSKKLDELLDELRVGARVAPNKRRALMAGLGYEWHPHLTNGRVNNVIPTEGCKPRLYVKNGHLSQQLTDHAAIVNAYQAAQTMFIQTGASNPVTHNQPKGT